MTTATRRAVGILSGGATAIALAVTATLLARFLWPAYAVAEPSRAYTLEMLLVRLTVGAICTASAASVATLVARDRGRTALWLAAIALTISLPDHLILVWAAYPPWYHAVYLGSLLPIAGVAGMVTARWISRSSDPDRDT